MPFEVALVLGAFIGVVAALAWFARWYLRRRIPADAVARKPYNSTGKIFAAALILSLVIALVLVAAFPDGWLAWLLNSGGPTLFFVVAAGQCLLPRLSWRLEVPSLIVTGETTPHSLDFSGSVPNFERLSGGGVLLDVKPSFSEEATYQRLSGYGEQGRKIMRSETSPSTSCCRSLCSQLSSC
jgi:hypothetical protein